MYLYIPSWGVTDSALLRSDVSTISLNQDIDEWGVDYVELILNRSEKIEDLEKTLWQDPSDIDSIRENILKLKKAIQTYQDKYKEQD